ncbi:hypothetical protein BH23GEM9_BH23GEM9_23650 [soil metagenome]
MRARPFRFALLAAMLMTGAAACTAPPARVAVGELAPAFAAARLDGANVSLRELQGEVVLLNVWATWCFPCRREMPAFEDLHRDLGTAGLHVIAVSIDAASAARDVAEFIAEYDLTFDILHDPAQQVTRAFQTIGVPETYLIGADGRLLRHWIGRIDPRADNIRGPVIEALRERQQLHALR